MAVPVSKDDELPWIVKTEARNASKYDLVLNRVAILAFILLAAVLTLYVIVILGTMVTTLNHIRSSKQRSFQTLPRRERSTDCFSVLPLLWFNKTHLPRSIKGT